MKHRLYEGWIMARDELTPDQMRDLEAHLKECESCSRLAEAEKALEQVFTSVQMSEPMPGFAQRWKIRMGERRMSAHRRQTSWILGSLSVGATALFLPLLLETILVLVSPEDFLFDLAAALVDWLSLLDFVGDFVKTSVSTIFSTVPVALWLLVIVGVTGLGILCAFSLKRLGYLPK
jgi:predicted anti-sigma-YlaC factor YlaD